MNLRSFGVPTVVKHALGAVAGLADEVKALGIQRPLLIAGQGLVRTGIVDEVIRLLQAGQIDHLVFDQVIEKPPIAVVDAGAEV